MALRSRPLTRLQAERFKHALALLQSGQYAPALRDAQVLVEQAPFAADAWQLLGMCWAGSGGYDEAGSAFERAVALAPESRVVLRNYAGCLASHGKALRMQGRFEFAVPVLRKAVTLAPDLAATWVDLGVSLRMSGKAGEALDAYRRAEAILDPDTVDGIAVLDAISGALADAGRPAEALAHARRLVARRPDDPLAQETLSRLLWEYGAEHAPSEEPLAAFEAAVHAMSGNRSLQLGYARALLTAGRAAEALELLQTLRRKEGSDPLLDWFNADALDALRLYDKATPLYVSAARAGLGEMPDFLNAHARHAFRIGMFDLAARLAERVITIDPCNQEGWSHLGTAWRLMGDVREEWLCDYDTLVGYVEVPAPLGYPDTPAFLDALACSLDALHGASRAPLNQSVRGGVQTAGQLFGRDDAVIQAAEQALRSAADVWVATLHDDPRHPFLSRRQSSVRVVGSWSVKLAASGCHSNHIHPVGWASSAFHVSVPRDDAHCMSKAGWLQFGAPLEDLGLDLGPRRMIRPIPGHLALFPSYLWHGTVPFDAAEPRLSIAFDMQPID